MCLLDGVLDWDLEHVRCVSRSHHHVDHPLRARGQLSAVCGIEIAAQSVAVHGALLATGADPPRRTGYLAALRNVSVHVARLDDIAADLIALAYCLGRNDSTFRYEFSLAADARILLSGNATVILEPL